MKMLTVKTTLTKTERLRRALIVSVNFARSLGYHRGAKLHPSGWCNPPFHSYVNFCRVANGNFVEVCLLEWCKLFGDRKASSKYSEHFWMTILSDPTRFENELLNHLQLSAWMFEDYRCQMRAYRDKFIAHLDSEREGYIPDLVIAQKSVEFLYGYILETEIAVSDLYGLPGSLDSFQHGYEQSQKEAADAFMKLASGF